MNEVRVPLVALQGGVGRHPKAALPRPTNRFSRGDRLVDRLSHAYDDVTSAGIGIVQFIAALLAI